MRVLELKCFQLRILCVILYFHRCGDQARKVSNYSLLAKVVNESLQILVDSGGLDLKILLARRQIGPTQKYNFYREQIKISKNT